MVAYASLTARSLIESPDDVVIGRLIASDAVSGWTQVAHDQIFAWKNQLTILRAIASRLIAKDEALSEVAFVLEYRIPRREKRIDAAILLRQSVLLVEFKVGSSGANSDDIAQVLDYALDIAYYHAESHDKAVVPILCPTEMSSVELRPNGDDTLVNDLLICGSDRLADFVMKRLLGEDKRQPLISAKSWTLSQYKPIPGVIEATVRLFSKHAVEDIRSALAEDQVIVKTIRYVEGLISKARADGSKILCLITGVPGAGKTLTGLQIAHMEELSESSWRTVFMSGNGPLMKVLRAALAADYSKNQGISQAKARALANSMLHSVHSYLAESLRLEKAPAEKVIIFDEAQRAWDKAKMEKMAGKARKLGAVDEISEQLTDVHSEPWQLLSILDRHSDGAVAVALCGNGQEIHDGEAGVAEWISARNAGFPHWTLVSSPIAAELGGIGSDVAVTVAPELHLSVPFRSHRANEHAAWVDAVLAGDPTTARAAINQKAFPILLTRDLEAARDWLWQNTLGSRRCGLLASSGAGRLRPYGIEVSADFRSGVDYAQWFTKGRDDLRSSYFLEVAATEFECQGLELDRVGLCWSWDLLLAAGHVLPRTFRGKVWTRIKSSREQEYVLNKYRVLLTRAREGMIIWVPQGRKNDPSRQVGETDAIADYLLSCGVNPLNASGQYLQKANQGIEINSEIIPTENR